MRLVFAVAVVCAAAAIHPAHIAQPIETPHVSVLTSTSTGAGRLSLYVDVTPKPKMHVYAPGEKEGIPIAITLDSNPAIKAGKPVFPPPQKYFFPPLKLTQLVYSSPFRITLPITVTRRPANGSLAITGTLQYQACDDAVCYVPKTVAVKWELKAQSSIPE
jgi:DsbC/DsbD-like thiol-disulfide interchange protein